MTKRRDVVLRNVIVSALVLVGLPSVMPGCKEIPLCVPGLAEGKQYKFTIVEPYTKDVQTVKFDESLAQSLTTPQAPKCGEGFDLVSGSTVVIKIDRILPNQPCRYPEASLVSTDAVTLISQRDFALGGDDFMTLHSYNVQIGNRCKGSWLLQPLRKDDDIFGTNNPQETPHVRVRREFRAEVPEDCERPESPVRADALAGCSDVFVATLTPL